MKSKLVSRSPLIVAAVGVVAGAALWALAGPPGAGGFPFMSGDTNLLHRLTIRYGPADRVSIRIPGESEGPATDEIEFTVHYGIEHGKVRVDIAPSILVGENLRIARLETHPDGEHTYTFEASNGEIHLRDVPVEQFISVIGPRTFSWDVTLFAADGSTLWGTAATSCTVY